MNVHANIGKQSHFLFALFSVIIKKRPYLFYFLCVFIKFSPGLQGSFSFPFFSSSSFFLGHVAAIASPRPIKRDKYPPFPVLSHVQSVSVNQ